ncbi:MAG: WbqC family protein [Chitinophagaceae bacterium]
MYKPLVKTCDYFPSLAWFHHYVQAEHVEISILQTYQRKGMENRCIIGSANGPLVLSVPLDGGRNQHQALNTLKPAYHTRWQHQQAQAIRSAYGRTPYFDYFEALFQPVFTNQFESLSAMNLFILNACLKAMKIAPKHQVQTIPYEAGAMVHEYDVPSPITYIQPFSDRHGFMPNLSILDALMCCGPQTRSLLENSPKK